MSGFDLKFPHRFLYYAHVNSWLSDEDKDWQYPLIVILRGGEKNMAE